MAVSSVVAGATSFFPTWSRSSALAVGEHIRGSLEHGIVSKLDAVVEGYTTPATADIGAASVRLRLLQKQQLASSLSFDLPLRDGGYLFGIRSPVYGGRFLPAVAGVPGQQGLDRFGSSRVGLAECVAMGRPVSDGTFTVLPDDVLREWMPVGTDVEVVVLARLTDFFLGLNAGTWLRIRIGDLVAKGQSWVHEHCELHLPESDGTSSLHAQDALLEGTGLKHNGKLGPGIEDASAEFQYWGGSGNAGVSGQVIWLAEGTKMAAEG